MHTKYKYSYEPSWFDNIFSAWTDGSAASWWSVVGFILLAFLTSFLLVRWWRKC